MSGDAPLRRLALLVEYDGTAYSGSQYQRNAPTVQHSLERALSSLTGEPIRVALAGRTDAGVHAKGQVASFLTRSRHPAEVFVRGLNHHLPPDIAVRAAAEVPPAFDPRRQAVARWYRYTLYLSPARPAVGRHYVWQVAGPLDLEAMAEAARLLPGRHNFAAFTLPSVAARRRTEREVFRSELRRVGRLLFLDIEGNSFLPQQVRRIVGALVEVGQGRRGVEGFAALLAEARPGSAGYAAPPRGLCLMRVRYREKVFGDEAEPDVQPES